MRRRLVILGLLTLGFFAGWQLANAVMVSKAVSAPHATAWHILRTAVHPPYEIAAPHRTLLHEVRFRLIPGAAAQAVDCDCTESKPGCNSNCSGFCGKCPDCVNGPCTVYTCVGTSNTKKHCEPGMNTAPCQTCQLDKNVPCQAPRCIGSQCL